MIYTAPSGPIVDMLAMQTQALCALWQIDRRDSQTEYYTSLDHDLTIPFRATGLQVFRSATGTKLSSRAREGAMRSQTLDVGGVISGLDAVEIAGGAYHDARITEWVVDARWPYVPAAIMHTTQWWIASIEMTSEEFVFSLEGIGRKLKETVGVPFNQTCEWSLGQGGCKPNPPQKTHGVDIGQYTFGANSPCTVSGVDDDTNRQVFAALDGSGNPALPPFGRWAHGRLTWITGGNVGMEYEIMRSAQGLGGTTIIWLFEETARPITTADTYRITFGCDGTRASCAGYQNELSFRGNDYIPGTQRARQTAKIDWNDRR